MKNKIFILPGDGIGPEIMESAVRVIKTIEELSNDEYILDYGDIGGSALDKYNVPLTDIDLDKAKSSNAVLLGAVGGYKWDSFKGELRPESGLLKLRKELKTFANIRPVKLEKSLSYLSPIKEERLDKGVDMFFIRELTGGIYFGDKGRDGHRAYDVEEYSVPEVKRIAKAAFEFAKKRSGKLTSVDKMNVLESSRLWRDVVVEMSSQYPDVILDHVLVDNCAMKLITNPTDFDCILTSNMFGDILTDEASVLSGSIGLLPSMSYGDEGVSLYEPIHGSAPDIAGHNIANPIGMIKSVSMMFKYSFDKDKESDIIEKAISRVIDKGYRTKDMLREKGEYKGTKEITDIIIDEIKAIF